MRTMKKVIALSLVLAMALSMMATAAFKDQEAINEDLTGDISLMVALNVFSEQGTGAGYFEPNRELTREEVAKLIYVLKNKGVDNGATSWTGMNIFKDIESGRWSEGYINYAASVGMMAGTGEGYFNPTAKMSAVEVAKLLLVLNGYKADVQGYLGANWDVNIIRDAEAAGIFSNYELPVRGSVTREWVARLMNNGIYATKVKYEDGQVQEMYNQQNVPVTFAKQDLGLVETTGILMATANAQIIDKDGEDYAGVAGTVANGGKANCVVVTENDGNKVFKYDAPLSLLGHKVTVLSKGALNTSNKVYGVTTHKDNVVTTTTVDAVKYDAKNFESNFVIYSDYKGTKVTAKDFFGKADGRTVTLVDYDNNGKFDVAFVKGVAYDLVTYVNPSSKTLNLKKNSLNGVKYEDINFVDSIAKGDVIKITTDFVTGEAVKTVQKVDVVTGAVTKVTSDGVATIDGNEYKLHKNPVENNALSVNKTAMNYFVDGKYVVYFDEISSAAQTQTNIAYVIKAANAPDMWGEDVPKVDILKNDGTREVLEYKVPTGVVSDTATNVNGENAENQKKAYTFEERLMEGKLVEYVMKDGKVYFKRILEDNAVKVLADASDYDYKKSTGKLENGTSTYLTNDDSYFFVVKEGKYSVVKASEVSGNTTTEDDSILVYNKTGLPYIKYGVLKDAFTSDSSTGYGISARAISTVINEDDVKVDQLVVTKMDGTEVILTAPENEDQFANAKLGKFVKYTIGTDGYADVYVMDPSDWYKTANEHDTEYNYVLANLTHAEGNAVVIDGTYMELAKDAKIYYVDSFKSSDSNVNNRVIVSEGDGLITSAEITEGNYNDSVYYRVNSDGEITHIIVEIHGEKILSNNEIQNVQ